MQYDRTETCLTIQKFLLYKFSFFFLIFIKKFDIFFRFLSRPLPSKQKTINFFQTHGNGKGPDLD